MIANDSMFSHNIASRGLSDEQLEQVQEWGVTTIDSATLEFESLYPATTPFEQIPTLEGACYAWSNDFIEKCLLAMATDKLAHFTEEELAVWEYFVNFENYHSHSARSTDANGTAIGCTNPNDFQQSFVVAQDGTINDGIDGRPLQLCQPPGYEVENEEIWKSLDRAFMSLYRCEPINNCLKDGNYQPGTCN